MAMRCKLCALALLAGSAMAADLPKEGTVDTSLCFGGPMHLIAAAPGERLGSYVVKGGTSAGSPAFDSMAVECTGIFEARAGATQSKGYCVFRDVSGDTIHGTDAITPEGYVFEYLGGTGKFKGISGSGRIERVGTLASEGDRMRGCRKMVGTYKFK